MGFETGESACPRARAQCGTRAASLSTGVADPGYRRQQFKNERQKPAPKESASREAAVTPRDRIFRVRYPVPSKARCALRTFASWACVRRPAVEWGRVRLERPYRFAIPKRLSSLVSWLVKPIVDIFVLLTPNFFVPRDDFIPRERSHARAQRREERGERRLPSFVSLRLCVRPSSVCARPRPFFVLVAAESRAGNS
jgi:hypothetical protein